MQALNKAVGNFMSELNNLDAKFTVNTVNGMQSIRGILLQERPQGFFELITDIQATKNELRAVCYAKNLQNGASTVLRTAANDVELEGMSDFIRRTVRGG